VDVARSRGGSARHRPGPARLLVVEDDRVIADAVARRLASEGFSVDTVHDGVAAVAAVESTRYDAVVLDVMLPLLDGLEVCRRIQAGRPVPVLMLTARAEEADRIIGLGVGADDYLTKPFSPRELVARVRALLRRVDRAAELATMAEDGAAADLDVAGLRLEVAARRVSVAGRQVHLTRTEFDLLHALAREPGRVVERHRLVAAIWDWPDTAAARTVPTRAVDSHIKALRRKLGVHRIRTVHGVGYALEVTGAGAHRDDAARSP
jgi:DNA-binding response OmpR family regulator